MDKQEEHHLNIYKVQAWEIRATLAEGKGKGDYSKRLEYRIDFSDSYNTKLEFIVSVPEWNEIYRGRDFPTAANAYNTERVERKQRRRKVTAARQLL